MHRVLPAEITVLAHSLKVLPKGTEDIYVPRLWFPMVNVLSTKNLNHRQEKAKKVWWEFCLLH